MNNKVTVNLQSQGIRRKRMRGFMFLLSGLLLVGAAAFGQDSDNDGLPDALDRRPHVAQYYQANPTAGISKTDSDGDGLPDVLDRRPHVAEYYQANPTAGVAGEDSDNDGLPDALDNRPHVAEYYQASGGEPWDRMAQMSGTDSDGDGLPDILDNRPHVAEYYNAGAPVPAEKPKPAVDSDGDGVVDDADRCPGTPAGVKVDARGCPEDSDGDGVPDYLDKCPGTPSGVLVDAAGCPRDSDNDGVTDDKDACPGTPAGAAVDSQGCPLDSDGDGVADHLDKCPNTPPHIEVDETGCPKIIKKGEKIVLDVQFATNSADPDEASQEILNGVAQTMKDFPEIKIAVRGFTDDVGSEAYNRQLSDRRAKAVMAYLEKQGVAGKRMSAKGFGEDPAHFVADNTTEAGRAKNRRVEIESVE
jgi:outer membrane protein OmpA-like peptidoglycan-associated protein